MRLFPFFPRFGQRVPGLGPAGSTRPFIFAVGIALAAAFPVLALLLGPSAAPPAPRPVGGILDLRTWDFAGSGSVSLAGEWDFFPRRLLGPGEADAGTAPARRTVPDFWRGADGGASGGRGAGTYRLRVLLPPGGPELALRIATVSTAFELYAGASLVASAGRPGVDPGNARAAYAPGVSAGIPASPDGEAVLVCRVSNWDYRYGGMWRAPELGPRSALERAKRIRDALDLLLFGILFGVFLQHVFIVLLRRHAQASLFFALLAADVALRSAVTGEYQLAAFLPNLPFGLLVRLEYVTSFTLIPLAAHFLSVGTRRPPPYPVLVPSALFLFLVPWAPLPLLTRSMPFYYPVAAFSLAYIALRLVVPIALSTRPDRFAVVAASTVLISAAVNDMLYSSFLSGTGNLLPAALVAAVVLLSYSLAAGYDRAFLKAERLAEEKDALLREMHHRVKNSLQIVSSVAAMQAHRARVPETVAALESMRDRIRAVARVHERLHAAPSDGTVDLGSYARDLTLQTAKSAGDPASPPPVVDIAGDAGLGTVEFCVDYGLALTELLLNAYKHGAALRSVRVSRSGAELATAVLDRGSGFEAPSADWSGSSLGFKIVSSVARKYRGRMEAPGSGDTGLLLILIPPSEDPRPLEVHHG